MKKKKKTKTPSTRTPVSPVNVRTRMLLASVKHLLSRTAAHEKALAQNRETLQALAARHVHLAAAERERSGATTPAPPPADNVARAPYLVLTSGNGPVYIVPHAIVSISAPLQYKDNP